ncbi:hypothetical protein [Methylobacterium iners]|uniref:Uncharacterized protein n=1 Tax=Methylobacterium iners TaxID=418707 RepID=A0ABQ4S317_9HYPH|nr:hypothetical protein [Methylobacterium iners]GJD97015.1 hypothetical protein OCOJLMKI_4243 [Methylobacterium iners]
MYRTLVCLTVEHKAWVIPLSAFICWLSCQITFYLLGQARQSREWSVLV